MNIHNHTRLTLLDRKEIWQLYQTRCWKVTHLAECFWDSRPTIELEPNQQVVLDRATHHWDILETGDDSYRLKQRKKTIENLSSHQSNWKLLDIDR